MSVQFWILISITCLPPPLITAYFIFGYYVVRKMPTKWSWIIDLFLWMFSLLPIFGWIVALISFCAYDGNQIGEAKKWYSKKVKCTTCKINSYRGYLTLNSEKCPHCNSTNYTSTEEPVPFPPFSKWKTIKTILLINKINRQRQKNRDNDLLAEQLLLYQNLQKKKLEDYMKKRDVNEK